MATVYQEYRNEHAQRAYPFTDDATFLARTGIQMPIGWVLDAFLHIPSLQGALYVSEIAQGGATVVLRDTTTNTIRATGRRADDLVVFVDTTAYQRNVGCFAIDPDIQVPSGTHAFDPGALPLCSTAYVGLNQPGVRGITAATAHIATNAVTLEGRGGFVVTTLVRDDKNIVRIDAIGAPPPSPLDCVEACNPITHLRIENVDCAQIRGTHVGDGILAITVPHVSLDDLCAPKQLDDPGDVCVEPPVPPPEDWPCLPDTVDVVPVVHGRIEIVAPSTADADNPVHVDAQSAPGIVPGALAGTVDRNNALRQQLQQAVSTGGTVVLRLKGGRA